MGLSRTPPPAGVEFILTPAEGPFPPLCRGRRRPQYLNQMSKCGSVPGLVLGVLYMTSGAGAIVLMLEPRELMQRGPGRGTGELWE